MMNVYRTETPRWDYSPLPWLGVIAIALAGLVASGYLAYLHYAVHTKIGYSSFCAYSKTVNCDTVAQSPYSVFLGVPVAVWGILGYALMLFLSFLGLREDHSGRRLWILVYFISALFVLVSLVLGAVSALLIKSKCVICMFTYGLNLLLFFFTMSVRSKRRVKIRPGIGDDVRFLIQRLRLTGPAFGSLALLSVVMIAFFPSYWKMPPTAPSSDLEHGVTEEGRPWIGAKNARLTILEFTDYQCFYCRKAHFLLKDLLYRHKGAIKIVYYPFPLDKNCNPRVEETQHEGSCDLAFWTLAGLRQGKFWEMHDALFERRWDGGELTLKELASMVDADYDQLKTQLEDPDIRKLLFESAALGNRLGITATPGFVVEGRVYMGKIPEEIILDRLGSF
ncbi:MAG: thioredoxin domain-containing protein [Deltaproteobacteria bacterium]|nr:thioredoxin domain-containing protein [Deltaproteobacteria bacterium]